MYIYIYEYIVYIYIYIYIYATASLSAELVLRALSKEPGYEVKHFDRNRLPTLLIIYTPLPACKLS